MKPRQLSLRDVTEAQETFEGSPRSCRTKFMWLNWCPVDIVLWVLVVAVTLLVIWRMFVHKSGSRAVSAAQQVSYLRSGHKKLYCRPNSMTVDPYYIPQTFSDSLISKDPSFRHTPRPASVLGDKKKWPSLQGLTVETHPQNSIEGGEAHFPEPLSTNPYLRNYTAHFDDVVQHQSPPPAYVRNPRNPF